MENNKNSWTNKISPLSFSVYKKKIIITGTVRSFCLYNNITELYLLIRSGIIAA